MTIVRRMRASTVFLLRRLRASWVLSLAVVLGIASLVGVWVGLPLYAESASSRLLSIEVDDAANDGVPFGYLFSYNRLSGGNQSWEAFAPLSELIDGPDAPFGSTVRAKQRFTSTIPFDLVTKATVTVENSAVDSLAFVSLTGFEAVATLSQGRFAAPASSTSPASAIEVMLDEDFARDNNIAVNEELSIVNRRVDIDDPNRTFDVVVTGLWSVPARAPDTPVDPTLRFLQNGTLTGNLVVPEQTIRDALDPLTAATLSNAQWLVLLDSANVTTDSVTELLANTTRISRQVDDRLRGARLLVSPETSLENFQQDVADLNRGLALFSLPTLALALAVVSAVIALRWQRRQGEVTLLRRRGVPATQIIAETWAEAVILAVGGAAVGFFVARVVATFMGRTETFLRQGPGVDLTLVMNSRSWQALIVSTVIAAILVVLPSLSSLRQGALVGSSAVTGSRASLDGGSRRPWWQRTRLDLAIVVAIGFFSWFLLRRNALQGDLLDDPIVILLPAANAFAAGLIAVRLLPWVAQQLASVLERGNGTAGLLVARRIARIPRALTAPLLLLVITGALAIYTGSLARTLDLQLFDTAHHIVGAQNSVTSGVDAQLGNRFQLDSDNRVTAAQGGPSIDPDSFSKIWGIRSASRFAALPGRITPSVGGAEPATFVGVDTTTFANVAFWRADYASVPLSDLMARLDATPDSLLVNSAMMRDLDLALGDIVNLAVRDADRTLNVDMVIVGSFRQFPTWVPGSDTPPIALPPVVGSLADFEARAGAGVARLVLYEPDSRAADEAQTRADLARLGISTVSPSSAAALVERVQLEPARQGIFGLLTVSFVFSVALTVAGFVFYALFGFRRQLTEIGVLRALGLPARGLQRFVAFDLALLALAGVGFGAALGLAMARWYLPELVDNPIDTAPRMLEEIDWQAAIAIPVLLTTTLTIVAALLVVLLRRIRLFEAIKVGEPQ